MWDGCIRNSSLLSLSLLKLFSTSQNKMWILWVVPATVRCICYKHLYKNRNHVVTYIYTRLRFIELQVDFGWGKLQLIQKSVLNFLSFCHCFINGAHRWTLNRKKSCPLWLYMNFLNKISMTWFKSFELHRFQFKYSYWLAKQNDFENR